MNMYRTKDWSCVAPILGMKYSICQPVHTPAAGRGGGFEV
jgi:hypothetical protein